MDSDEKLVHISQTDLSISSLSNQLEVYAVLRCTASQFCDEHIRLGFRITRVSACALYALEPPSKSRRQRVLTVSLK